MASKSKALAAASKVREIGVQANGAFIQREEYVKALTLACVSGTHIVVLGPPGTGKSALIRFFSEALGTSFFKKLLNPDIKREDLVGPINPKAVKEGKWDRAWLGLATSQFVFLDEIGKASSQVRNMLLDAMEERTVSSGDIEKSIPLHLLASASNETLDDEDQAIWDRFSIRTVVGYITDADDMARFISSRGIKPTPIGIEDGDLEAMKAACVEMAQSPSDAMKDVLIELWTEHKNVSQERVSDRQWEKLLVVAAANALLEGRDEMVREDMAAARFMLWQTVDEIERIAEFIRSVVDAEMLEIQASTALVEELENLALTAASLEEMARINYRADKLQADLQTKSDRADWVDLRTRLDKIKDGVLNS